MESIAVTKPGMGVLSQERLLLSPFGALAQAFSQEILDRARKEEGRWSYVPLDLLEEGEESQTAPAVPPVIQVDLHLVLEALRREKGESEQRRATERIVERILQIREVRDRPAAQSPARPRLEERTPASPMGVLRQNISQTLVQENRFGPFLLAEAAAKGREASKIPSAPGTLGRQAEALAQVFQDLREGVGPAAAETGRMNAVEGEARTRLPRAASVSRIMPREELTHREEAGEDGAAPSMAQAPALERTARQAAEQLQEQVRRRVEQTLERETRRIPDHAMERRTGRFADRTPERTQPEPDVQAGSGKQAVPSTPEVRQQGRTSGDVRRPREEKTSGRTAPAQGHGQPVEPELLWAEKTEETGEAGARHSAAAPGPSGRRQGRSPSGRGNQEPPAQPERQRGEFSAAAENPAQGPEPPRSGQSRLPAEAAASAKETGAPAAQPQTGGTGAAGLSPENAAGVTAPISTTARDPRVGGPGLEAALNMRRDSRPDRTGAEAGTELPVPGAELTYWKEPAGEADRLPQEYPQSAGMDLPHGTEIREAAGDRTPKQNGPTARSKAPEGGALGPAHRAGAEAGPQQETVRGKTAGPGAAPDLSAGQTDGFQRPTEQRSMRREGAPVPREGGADQISGAGAPALGSAPGLTSAQDIRVLAEGLTAPGPLAAAADLGGGETSGRELDVPPPGTELTFREEGPQSGADGGMLPPERETAGTLPIRGETPRQGADSAQKGAARTPREPGASLEQSAFRPERGARARTEGPGAAWEIRTAPLGRTAPGQGHPVQEEGTAQSWSPLPGVELTHRPGEPGGGEMAGRPDGRTQAGRRPGDGAAPQTGADRGAAAPQGTEKTGPAERARPDRAEGQSSKGAPGIRESLQGRKDGPAEAVRQRAEPAGEQSTRRTAPRQTGGGPAGAETERGGAPRTHRTGPGGLLRTAREIRTLGPVAGMPGEPGWSGSGEAWTAEAGGALSLAFLNQEGAESGMAAASQGEEPEQPRRLAGARTGAPLGLETAARDIRVGGALEQGPGPAELTPGEAAGGPALAGGPLDLYQIPAAPAGTHMVSGRPAREAGGRSGPAPQAGTGVPESGRGKRPLTARLSQHTGARSAARPAAALEPLELSYGPVPAGAAPPDPAQTAGESGSPAESAYVKSLPDWARRFLREGAAQSVQSMGTARNIASLPSQGEGNAVQWTAPNYRPPAAPMTYREKPGREERQAGQQAPRISEAELQRTADRVYRMIEDRIRRERRRLGL
ncbi:hypothetical protein [Pseudoflavonifractor capillosus]|uniref:hypothetical protein n=1 Tax=Pseudoflavonifractor capillosus TaxID=106588 RepID=UPI00195A87F5|nr:hypothetical protein [Pseudoflavonifractor capillosus]MBM6681248.1 hypothetical protein [Pseudoflavonifractor capillosus]